jgi:hypothetical protein
MPAPTPAAYVTPPSVDDASVRLQAWVTREIEAAAERGVAAERARIVALLEPILTDGCECDCDCAQDEGGHDDTCELMGAIDMRCVRCRVEDAVGTTTRAKP